MRNFLLAGLLFLVALPASAQSEIETQQTSSQPFQAILVYGDSMSDDGNTYQFLSNLHNEHQFPSIFLDAMKKYLWEQHMALYFVALSVMNTALNLALEYADDSIPLVPEAPYWNHHFSNGPVWFEYLQTKMFPDDSSKTYSYFDCAFGGSWAQTYDGFSLDFLSATESVKDLIVGKLIPPSVGMQIFSSNLVYQRASGSLGAHCAAPLPDPRHTLFFILAGGNDYINMTADSRIAKTKNCHQLVKDVTNSIETTLTTLLNEQHAQNILLIGLPDLGAIPRFKDAHDKIMRCTNEAGQVVMDHKDVMSLLSHYHNQEIAALSERLAKRYTQAKIHFFDPTQTFNQLIAQPEKFGFSNATDACIKDFLPTGNLQQQMQQLTASQTLEKSDNKAAEILNKNIILQQAVFASKHFKQQQESMPLVELTPAKNICSDPSQYVFWDDLHPTTKAHEVLAGVIYQQVVQLF